MSDQAMRRRLAPSGSFALLVERAGSGMWLVTSVDHPGFLAVIPDDQPFEEGMRDVALELTQLLADSTSEADWRARLGARHWGIDPAYLNLVAKILANQSSSSDALLILADALREASQVHAARGAVTAAAEIDQLAQLIADEAPERAA